MEENVKKQMDEYLKEINRQREMIDRRIVGLPSFKEGLFTCYYSHGEGDLVPNILVEADVGTGKTALLKNFQRTVLAATFSRIQCMPDLKPQDLIRIVEQCQDRSLVFHQGPIFAHIVLADEINRSHEKTRAALLEAMGEGQVTIGKSTYPLDKPFFVMASENPIDTEGIYKLGAAQLDRFMMRVYTEEPTEEEEIRIALMHQEKPLELEGIIPIERVTKIRDFIRQNIFMDLKVVRAAVRIVRYLRPGRGLVSGDDFYFLPKGKRGYLFLIRGAQVRAFLRGRDYVSLDDVEALAYPILNHRIGPKDQKLDIKKIITESVKRVREDEARGLLET